MSDVVGVKIKCRICGEGVHAIHLHLKESHPETTLDAYKHTYPDAPVFSDIALMKIQEHREKVDTPPSSAMAAASVVPIGATAPRFFHDVFELGDVSAAKNARGHPIPCEVLAAHGPFSNMVPRIDPNFVFEVELLKNAVMGVALNFPVYAYGHAGTGKTSLLEQIAARTNRPLLRVQHTIGMEERDVLGQWTARAGHTTFQLGPLALAMKHGWFYLADEYDFALPAVLGVYQPVLEGKSLVIKEADEENRVIVPHPNFRFGATGNTNGCGDETGLYQGTQMQNAANYDRMGIVLQVRYMDAHLESQMLVKQAGIGKPDADKLVDFATKVREAYEASKISGTMSPRSLIRAAQVGIRRGSWRVGVTLTFINKLSRVDREVVDGVAQRVFG